MRDQKRECPENAHSQKFYTENETENSANLLHHHLQFLSPPLRSRFRFRFNTVGRWINPTITNKGEHVKKINPQEAGYFRARGRKF